MNKTNEQLNQSIGWLNAYRNGWVSYDPVHVRQLKTELKNEKTSTTNASTPKDGLRNDNDSGSYISHPGYTTKQEKQP